MASKNAPDLIISGAGWLTQFASGAILGLRARGVTDEEIHRLGTQAGAEDMERGVEAYCDVIAGPLVPSYDPETGIYRFMVNYDESIAVKTADRDPKSLAWVTDYATDKKFPDDRTGTLIRTGRIMHFDKRMGQDELEQWAEEHGKVLAWPKELIEFSKSFPRPALDEDMPLAGPGQFWARAHGPRSFLYLRRRSAGRDLYDVWLDSDEQWSPCWRFLVLDK